MFFKPGNDQKNVVLHFTIIKLYNMFWRALRFRILLLILISFTFSTFSLKAENHSITFPSWFTKNQGQYPDGSKYCLKTASSSTFFFDTYLVHQFASGYKEQDSDNNTVLNLRIDFENSNPGTVFEERDPMTSKASFFKGNDASAWKTDISTFGSLAYKDLYNNIDLVYHNTSKGIKSDFIVHHGGKFSDIKLKYQGVTAISINAQGALQLCTDEGEITEHIPEAYQLIDGTKVPVKVTFTIEKGFKAGFSVQDFNPDYDLVIDPQLVYCSYFGGNNDDIYASEIIRDSKNNIYFAGRTISSDFPTTAGAFLTSTAGESDAFVIKLDPTGTKMLFCTYIGGPGNDLGFSLKLTGSADDILVHGMAGEGAFPTTAGAYQTIQAGYEDFFMLKLNNGGNNLIFSTLVGGFSDEEAGNFCVDKNGDIYVVGYAGTGFPTTSVAYQQIVTGDYDACVFKLSADGSQLLYSTLIGGPDRDRAGGIVLDALSNVYISVWILGDFPTTSGAYDRTFNGDADIAICKFDPTLSNLIFSTLVGGPGEDLTILELMLDKDNNPVFTGRAASGFPTTTGAFDQTYNGGLTDGIIVKLSKDGTQLLYSSYIGGPGDDFARDFTIDYHGNLVITGYCGTGFPLTACPYDDTYNGGTSDCFITKFDISTSSLLYSSYFGGSGNETGNNIITSVDTIILLGSTTSLNLPVTSNAYDQTYNGGTNDMFVVKILPGAGNVPIAQFSNKAVSCVNQSVNFINSTSLGTDFKWDFGDGDTSITQNPSHSYFLPGTYTIRLLASNLCGSDSTTRTLKIDGYMAIDSVSICNGDSVMVNGLYRYSSGNYDMNFPLSSGCDSIFRTTLSLVTIPPNTLPDSIEICYGQSVLLDAGDCKACKYLWSDGSSGHSLLVDKEGKYYLEVSIGSCITNDSVKVKTCDLFLPNVFTPNNDGKNERFKPVYQGVIRSYQVVIINRWGQQLYESTDAYAGWDGTFNGKQCPDGAYFYLVKYSMGSEPSSITQREKRGSITILR